MASNYAFARRKCGLCLAVAALACLGALRAHAAEAAAQTASFEKDIQPLLQTYCYECHANGKKKGGLSLDDVKSATAVTENRKVWDTLMRYVRTREMPPEEAKKQPTQAERDLLSEWVEKELYRYDPSHPDPGHVTLRRLNRAEYNNTIRDLVGVDFHPADDFPTDDSGYGFDNIGDVLSLPPMLLEKYLVAANKVLDQAIPTEPITSRTMHLPASLAEIGFNELGDRGDGWIYLITLEEGDVSIDYNAPVAGDYLVRFQAYGNLTGGKLQGQGSDRVLVPAENEVVLPPRLAVYNGDIAIKDFEISTDAAHPGVYQARVGLPQGKNKLRVVMHRLRGGENELLMLNGKIGLQQWGIGFVKWVEVEGPMPSAVRRFPARQLAVAGEGSFTPKGDRVLEHNGNVSLKFNVPKSGDYILRAYAYAQQSGNETARLQFSIDGQALETFDVLAPARLQARPRQNVFSQTLLREMPAAYEAQTHLTPGEKVFSAAFTNDFADPDNENPNLRDRNLIIQALEISDLSSPALAPTMPDQIKHFFAMAPAGADKATQARAILNQFAFHAWRRPVKPGELDQLMKLYAVAGQNGESFEGSVKLAMAGVLVSPHFLFREELPLNAPGSAGPRQNLPAQSAPAPAAKPGSTAGSSVIGSPLGLAPPQKSFGLSSLLVAQTVADVQAVEIVPVDEFALASRLSYFIWSSMPDDELLNLAEKGQLRQNLDAQVKRLLASPKSRALVDNFASQWLQFRSLSTFAPDKSFTNFTPAIKIQMQRETEAFCSYIITQDRSVMDFLTANYTFVNPPLAKYYGLPEITGGDDVYQKVSLDGTGRQGVLTQGSVLVLTSNPTRTSPVKRGKWVLDNLLGTPPPPPPANVPQLDDEHRQLTGTLRQQMEQHRENPTCAGCHARMDPIGFGLENFDAVGAWRDQDGAAKIDSSGKLTSGESFQGATDLVKILADKKKENFLRCLAEKMLTYALGRGLEYYDRAASDKIVQKLESGDDKFSTLILEVTQSIPFQYRRAQEPASDPAPAVPDPKKVASN